MKGKTIVVTGAASGIGAQTAKLFSERGAYVIGLDCREPKEHVSKFVSVDLSKPASIEEAVGKIGSGIDGLCNIAGVPPTKGVELVLQVNFLGLRKLTESLIDKMNRGAAIVNVASLAGSGWAERLPVINEFIQVRDFSETAAFCKANNITDKDSYSFSKESLIVWTMMNWKMWLKQNIRMNCVSPGPVETSILGDFRATIGRQFEEVVALLDKKAATVDDVAPVIAFMCSDASAWIRGANIPVDGGMKAQVTRKRLGF